MFKLCMSRFEIVEPLVCISYAVLDFNFDLLELYLNSAFCGTVKYYALIVIALFNFWSIVFKILCLIVVHNFFLKLINVDMPAAGDIWSSATYCDHSPCCVNTRREIL
jgi:hypothetical protein